MSTRNGPSDPSGTQSRTGAVPVPGHTPATVIPDWWATRRDHPAPDHTSPTVPMPSPNRAGDP